MKPLVKAPQGQQQAPEDGPQRSGGQRAGYLSYSAPYQGAGCY